MKIETSQLCFPIKVITTNCLKSVLAIGKLNYTKLVVITQNTRKSKVNKKNIMANILIGCCKNGPLDIPSVFLFVCLNLIDESCEVNVLTE